MTFNNTTPANFFDTLATGRASSSPFVDIFLPRDPTVNDVTSATSINTYAIQQKWLNTATNELWELKNFLTSNGVTTANWIKIGGSNNTETLTGNTGGAVPPTANNINVVGDGVFITTVGTPGTSTLTIEPAGGLTTLYTENTGTATPSAGNLNVLGTNGISTTGSGNTITINGAGAAGKFIVDAHTAPGTSPVVPDGTGQITVTGGQVAAGTTTHVIRTDSLAANTYTIEIQRSQAVGSSTVGDNGVCHFNSAQFTVDSNGFVSTNTVNQVNIQTFTSSGTYTPTTGMVYCVIEVMGGGGGSGGVAGAAGSNSAASGGGGGGGYAKGVFSSATIGVSQTVTIGAGGTAGAAGNNAGGAGGTTSVGALISATGGNGSAGVVASGDGNSGSGGTGGTGTGGQLQLTGGTGLGGGWLNNGAGDNFVLSGYGGSSMFAQGSIGNWSGVGIAGIGPGSGAGGAATNANVNVAGGAGFKGIVVITEYIS